MVRREGDEAPPRMKPALPTLSFTDADAFGDWLADNHGSSPGVWLKLAKKGSGVASVSYAEAVEVALTWGWIDGQKQPHDARHWLQKFTPRGARSLWSKINRDKATALIAARKMMAPGLAEIERAKRDGRWDAAYDSTKSSTMPADLQAALDGNARARRAWATIDPANRYAILWRVQTAKKAETRARRIVELVAMLGRGELLHPARGKKATGAR
jgi:uncharacterized protein YdeI (YjbR/CyaY-like superfamily)